MVSDIRLEVRPNEEAQIIRARIPNPDKASDFIEVATLNMRIADMTPGLFDLWRGFLKEAIRMIVEEASGASVGTIAEFRQGDMN